MKIYDFQLGHLGTNTYLIFPENSDGAILVDCPYEAAEVIPDFLKQAGRKLEAILLTHGHFDHAQAAEELAKEFGISIYAHEQEKRTLEDPSYNVSGMIGCSDSYHADVFLKDEQELDMAGFHIRVLHTPGHTTGGCCYYLPYEDVLFSGDTLFAQSVGRTDFPGGSMSQIVRSIKEKLMVLPEHTTVYPGHNEATSIEAERMYNPYL